MTGLCRRHQVLGAAWAGEVYGVEVQEYAGAYNQGKGDQSYVPDGLKRLLKYWSSRCSIVLVTRQELFRLYGQQPANQVIIRERYRDNDSDLALGMLAGAATGMALGSLFWVF
ncbi:hypothetical protein J1605_014174 [Eschrichtius robustus]|uniref:Uncharacterized protein n=1 Tax=Eschrichtius robustus TaxID=9764 RepID=A0AB34GD16_ESCRO|nr:hypothetical protein J1605_014174 [Eschrichtius robustus]